MNFGSTIRMDIQSDINQFHKLPKQKQTMIIALIVILFIASIIVGAYLTKENEMTTATPLPTETQTQPTAPSKPSTTLMIDPSEIVVSVGKTTSVAVVLSQLPVTASDIYLTYDPSVIAISNLKNGIVFEKQTTIKGEATINNDEGIIAYHGSVKPVENAAQSAKTGTIFTFDIKGLKKIESTALTFMRNNKTKTALAGNNTLGMTNGLIIEVE